MNAMAVIAPPLGLELDLLRSFDIAGTALIEARSLQQRVDRKYLLAADALEPLLARLRPGHCLLHAGEHGWARYENIYFDTPDRTLYHAHRCGRRPRYKVRIRHHVDRQLSFLEIKSKTNSGRTMKRRLAVLYGQNHLGAPEQQFIDTYAPTNSARLMPCVSISFLRLTLVGKGLNERLTFDRDVTFVGGPREERFSRVVVGEVKQVVYSNHLGAVPALRTLHARETAFSKYCIGTLLVAPVAGNIFKPTLKAVERLSA
ncbi:MAG: polyphosphate polymerase domain-containing protein [Vicinamibacterales bacterium]